MKNLVITREYQAAQDFAASLAQTNTFIFPCLEFKAPNAGYDQLDKAIRENHLYDWIFFLSRKSADCFFSRLLELGGHLFHLSPHLRIAAVGQSTADYIFHEIGFPVNFVPSEFNAQTLASEFMHKYLEPQATPGADPLRVILPRNEIVEDDFSSILENSRQMEINTCPAYRTECPAQADLLGLKNFLQSNEEVFIQFASSETVKNFIKLCDGELLNTIRNSNNIKLVSIGPETSETIRDLLGDIHLIQAQRASLENMAGTVE